MHGGAVTTFLLLPDVGRPRFCEPPEPPPDEPPELPPEEPPELPPLELDCAVHGGTMIVVTPLFDGSTSWFWGVDWPPDDEPPPEPDEDDAACAFTPPGVSRTVLDGGGWLEPLELPPDDPPELPPDDDDEELCGGGQGCTATVCVSVPCGTTMRFEPGGICELPDCATCASEQGGTAIVRSPCCLGITTVRTPGVCIAVETGSIWELELLLPQAPRPIATSAIPAAANARKPRSLINPFASLPRPLVVGSYPTGAST